jgi:uncharacterized protein DUF4382
MAGLLACGDSSMSPGTGQVSILLKDAPGDVVAAVVTISEVDLVGGGGTQVLMNTPVTTDLLTLASTTASLVQNAVIPAGTYDELRFVITGGYVEVDNGNGTTSIYASSPNYAGLPQGATVAGPLQMPSYGQSGLKVTLPGNALTIANGGQKILVVDFDVSQSFGHQAGGSGMWVMHPVCIATDIGVTGGATVTLTLGQGLTLPAGVTLDLFTATLTDANLLSTTAAFTDANNDGTFEATFGFLAAGPYTLTLTAPGGVTSFTTSPALPQTVNIQAGTNATTAALVITAIS